MEEGKRVGGKPHLPEMCLMWIRVFSGEGTRGKQLPVPCKRIMWHFTLATKEQATDYMANSPNPHSEAFGAPFIKGTLVGGSQSMKSSPHSKSKGKILSEGHCALLAGGLWRTLKDKRGITHYGSICTWQAWQGLKGTGLCKSKLRSMAADSQSQGLSDPGNMLSKGIPPTLTLSAPISCLCAPHPPPPPRKGHLWRKEKRSPSLPSYPHCHRPFLLCLSP